MRRDITSWFSHNLGMDMPLVAYGHAGFPLLMFPTAAADYLETTVRPGDIVITLGAGDVNRLCDDLLKRLP